MAPPKKTKANFHSETSRGMVVNRSELAHALDVALTTIDIWIRQGCPVIQKGAGRGQEWQFSLAAVVKWKAARDVSEATGKTQSSEAHLNLRRTNAQTQQAELALAKELGQVAPLDQVERMVGRAFAEVRTNLRSLPGRVVNRLVGETDERKIKKMLLEEIDLCLEALANADLAGSDDDDDQDEYAAAA